MQALKDFRTYFFRGLAALLPTVVTIWVFFQCYIFIQANISRPINTGLVQMLTITDYWYPVNEEEIREYVLSDEPQLSSDSVKLAERVNSDEARRQARIVKAEEDWIRGHGQIAGFLIALVSVCFIGAILASVVGRTVWHFIERGLMNLPLVKRIYPYIKQITDLMLTKKDLAFSKVVAIQYPRKELWSVALVTGKGLRIIREKLGQEMMTVFVPTSPTPFTGYVIMVEVKDTIELNMTIEEALRFTISGGVITPAEHEAFKALSSVDVEDE
jgi:uncharacterized membrane protein